MDKLYACLKDLAEERNGRLQERLRLTQLKREVDDLEQWIAEREVVAGSHELGQDYDHVTVSCWFFFFLQLYLIVYSNVLHFILLLSFFFLSNITVALAVLLMTTVTARLIKYAVLK